jgi:hypothetical protein
MNVQISVAHWRTILIARRCFFLASLVLKLLQLGRIAGERLALLAQLGLFALLRRQLELLLLQSLAVAHADTTTTTPPPTRRRSTPSRPRSHWRTRRRRRQRTTGQRCRVAHEIDGARDVAVGGARGGVDGDHDGDLLRLPRLLALHVEAVGHGEAQRSDDW